MLKLALLVPVVFALGGAGGVGAITVEGSSPVALGKNGTAYPVKCAAPITFKASGPASLIVDVRGQTAAMGKPLEFDFTRNEKSISKNALTLKKSKQAGKGFAGLGQVVLTVPDGLQTYALACDATSDIAMSFRLSKKAVKNNAAVAEIAVEPPKPDHTKTAEAPGEAPKAGAAGEAPTAAGGASSGAYVGLFTPIAF
jgi:hypothetical protein